MEILVTGATGFIGGAVARRLLAGGHRVHGLHRRPSQAAGLAAAGILPVAGDLAAPDPRGWPRVDAVVHAGAVINTADPGDYRRVNLEGTRALLRWAAAAPAPPRVVLVSSVGVYGRPAALPADEGTPPHPTNDYEATKLAAEGAVREAARGGLPAVIVRPAWVYGPGDRKNLKLFRMIARGRFRIVGRGDTPLSPVHVDDVADGIALAATRDEAAGGTFILGPPSPVTVRDLCLAVAAAVGRPLAAGRIPLAVALPAALAAELLWTVLPGSPPLSRRRLLFFTRPQAFSIASARRTLGFAPRVGLEEGTRMTAEWYRREGLL